MRGAVVLKLLLLSCGIIALFALSNDKTHDPLYNLDASRALRLLAQHGYDAPRVVGIDRHFTRRLGCTDARPIAIRAKIVQTDNVVRRLTVCCPEGLNYRTCAIIGEVPSPTPTP